MSILNAILGGGVLYEPEFRLQDIDYTRICLELQYTLGTAQRTVYDHPGRFKMLCCGRRFGKTYLSLTRLIIWALMMSGQREFWYVTKTQDSAKRIAWKLLQKIAPKEAVSKISNGELEITFTNGSTIVLMGADNPDSLRGSSLSGCVIDEAAYCKPKLWPEVIRPSLADTGGPCWHITTPAGLNHFYDTWTEHEGNPNWGRFSYTTLDGGRVPAEEVETARNEMDARSFRQEFLASFESILGRVYPEFGDDNITTDAEDTGGDILVGLDFNVSIMAGTLCSLVHDSIVQWGEIALPNSNTAEVMAYLKERFPNRRIKVYPDPTGNARSTTSSTGITDHGIIRAAGFKCISPVAPWGVKDKINATNALIRAASGRISYRIHPSCKNTIRALRSVTFKEGSEDFVIDKTANIEHWSDALGYLILSACNRLKPWRSGGSDFSLV